ncbi:MAG: hypothetical protein JW864_02475 [Spirochaetes bacterium]|nr:hypothetical protein [Spirochaetota bacterium]
MSTQKYGHLIKPLSNAGISGRERSPEAKKFMGPGNADVIVWPNGRDHLEGLAVNFSWGFYTGLGEWHPGMDPHMHTYPECLIYVGLDPSNIEYLGGEMQYCLGRELEVYTFDKPTVIIAPKGLPHCPAITKKVTDPKGYSFSIISLGAEPNSTWMGDGIDEEEFNKMQELAEKNGMKVPMKSSIGKKRIKYSEDTVTHGNKYARYVKPLKSPSNTPGPGNPDQSVWLFGRDLEGIDLNFSWGYYSKPGSWDKGEGLHYHPVDEVLMFVGLDPKDIEYLGAEIEIDMGMEKEKHVFNTPTSVILPAGTVHGSINVKSVEKPYGVYLISLGPEHTTISVK